MIKTYFISAVTLLTIGALIYCNNDVKYYQTFLTTHIPQLERTPAVTKRTPENNILQDKHIPSEDIIIAKANRETTLEKPTNETEIIPVAPDVGYSEPTSDNADMPATGEFAEQVNLEIEKISCDGVCADNETVDLPASGEFADQINTNELLIAAKNEGIEIPEYQKLENVAADSHPSTELGAYTPPSEL